jgi:Domain of unknown function in PX-proteins (DUF3818)
MRWHDFQGTTADLLKDIITIFYSPLAQVYKAASIADSLNDLQNFLNDLIQTVELGEECASFSLVMCSCHIHPFDLALLLFFLT